MNGPSVKLNGFAPGLNSFRSRTHQGTTTNTGAPILIFGKGRSSIRRRRMKGTGTKSPYTKRKVSKLRGRGVKSLQKKIEKQALKQQLAVARGGTQAVKQVNSSARREALVQTGKDVLGAANSDLDVGQRAADLYKQIQ